MNLRKRLTKVMEASIKEGVESSKDIISDNVVPSFEDMGMAKVAPGEFAQDEITDKENLVNKGDMANDTAFNKEGEHPVEKALDAATDMLDDLVDISAPKANATLEIIKTDGPEHGLDCHCPECCHKHHHGPFGESALKEDQPLFMIDPEAQQYYKKWYAQLSDPYGTMPAQADPEVIEEMRDNMVDLNNPSLADYVCAEISLTADKFWDKKEIWNSLIGQLVKDARENPDIDLDDTNAEWLPELKFTESAHYGKSIMGRIIEKALGGKTCEQYLKSLKESDYAGPKDFQPDMRINASDVLNAIKQEVGDGSEGVHVVKDLDERQDPIYRVTQIDKEKLPKTLTVETITLKWEENAYRPQGPSKEAPLTK